MRISFLFLSFALLSSSLSCSLFSGNRSDAAKVTKKMVPMDARSGDSIRKRVLVLPFLDADVKRSEKVTRLVRQAFVRSLLATDQFVVIDTADLPKDPLSFKKNDEFDLDELSKMAATLGVSAVMEGKVMDVVAKKVGDEVGLFRKVKAKINATVRLRVVAAKNGKELLNDVRSASIEDMTTVVGNESAQALEEDPRLLNEVMIRAFRGSIPAISKALDKLAWEGRIAMITGDRIFINSGRISGLQVGDILRVSDEGDDIFDPDTGVFIGKAPGRSKGTIEVISYFGKDGAIAVIHSGAGFKENDRIELY